MFHVHYIEKNSHTEDAFQNILPKKRHSNSDLIEANNEGVVVKQTEASEQETGTLEQSFHGYNSLWRS